MREFIINHEWLASKKLLMSFFKSILFRNLLTSTIFAMTWLALMLVRLPLSTALRITSAPSIKPLTLLLVTALEGWCCEVVCKASKRMALSWSLKQLATSSETPGSCNKTHNCTHYIKQKKKCIHLSFHHKFFCLRIEFLLLRSRIAGSFSGSKWHSRGGRRKHTRLCPTSLEARRFPFSFVFVWHIQDERSLALESFLVAISNRLMLL